MAKNNVQSVSHLLCMQVIKPQIIQKPQNQSCTQIYIKVKTYTRYRQPSTAQWNKAAKSADFAIFLHSQIPSVKTNMKENT